MPIIRSMGLGIKYVSWYYEDMFKISREQQTYSLTIAQQFGVDFLVIFGSQVAGATHQTSDLDIGYFAPKKLNFKQEYDLVTHLQKVFLHHKVDLVNLGAVSALLQHRACFGGELIAEATPHSFAKFQMIAYINYIDTSYLRILRNRHLTSKYA